MQRLRLCDIPAYLHSSDLYRSLQEGAEEGEEGSEFDVPEGLLKADDSVHSTQDARQLLSTLRYWGVGVISEPIVSFLVQSCEEVEDIQKLIDEFGHEFRYLEAFVKMKNTTSPSRKLEIAISVGVVSVVEYVRAAERVRSGNDMLMLKLYEGTQDDRLCALAAAGNHLECLEFLCSQGLKCGRLCTLGAAENGHLEVLRFLHARDCKWDTHVCAAAASRGSLECLQYLHEQKCPWDCWTCYYAAQNGHLPCLRYAHEHGCTWTVMTCVIATKKGNVDCLRYAHENGCSLDIDTNIMHICVQAGQVGCLKYLHSVKREWKASICAFAAAANQLECLPYAHEHRCPWDEVTCSAAAGEGNLECLQYAHKQGCPWDARTTRAAAQTRNTACLVYAVGNGCPCDADSYEILNELCPDGRIPKPAAGKRTPYILRCVYSIFAQPAVQSATSNQDIS
jgi:hypothetical protein